MAIRAHRIRAFIAAVVALVLAVVVLACLAAAMGWEVPVISNFLG